MGHFEEFDLTGRCAVVTGGATGLGYHMARALARSGATVLIAARRADLLAEAAARLAAEPGIGQILHDTVDLHDAGDIGAFAGRAIARMGRVDIVVGNAAVLNSEQIPDITAAKMAELLQVNLAANVTLSQAFLPGMRERRWGRFLFSSSTASLLSAANQGNVVYAATKAGLNAFMRALATDMGHDNITANAIVLGFFRTTMVLDAERQLREQGGDEAVRAFMSTYTDMMALGRMGEPEEVEGLVRLLASEAGRYITGASIPIDGGLSIMMRANPWGE